MDSILFDHKSQVVSGVTVLTLRELCEAERQRLLDIWIDKTDDGKYPLGWMVNQFGPTLTEKDGFVHSNGDKVSDCDCSLCGTESKPDQKVVRFSAYDQESDVVICLVCLEKIMEAMKCG